MLCSQLRRPAMAAHVVRQLHYERVMRYQFRVALISVFPLDRISSCTRLFLCFDLWHAMQMQFW
jgi:hypothetical protein